MKLLCDEREVLKIHCSKLDVESYDLQQNLQKLKLNEEEQFQQLKFMHENVNEMEKKAQKLVESKKKLLQEKTKLEKAVFRNETEGDQEKASF